MDSIFFFSFFLEFIIFEKEERERERKFSVPSLLIEIKYELNIQHKIE